MTGNTSHRVLFCISVRQNFMDATSGEAGEVWQAFSAMMKGMANLPGAEIIGTIDDDCITVGSSTGWPYTAYILADMPDLETITAACNLFRTTPVGDGAYKLWKYCAVETRIGRALAIPD